MSLGIIKVLLPALAVMLPLALPQAQPAQKLEVISEPAAVVRGYLRAVYARDFSEAIGTFRRRTSASKPLLNILASAARTAALLSK